MKNKKALVCIFIIGCITYINMLFNNFVWDDVIAIVDNPSLHIINTFGFFFGGARDTEGVRHIPVLYYRPLPFIYLSVVKTLFGNTTFFYHTFQLLFHIANTILIFFIFTKFFKRNLSLILALIFLIHPIQVESVSYIASIFNQLTVLFGLLSVYIATESKKITRSNALLIFFLLSFSLLSKESGVVFIPILICYFFLFKKADFRKSIALGVACLLFNMFLRIFLAATSDYFSYSLQYSSLSQLSLTHRLIMIPKVIYYYFYTFVFPKDLAISQHWTVPTLTFRDFWFPLCICILLIGICVSHIFRWKNNKKILYSFVFFTFWFGISFSFVLPILPLDMSVADRWFYIPIIGLLGIIGVFANTIPIQKIGYTRVIGVICVLIITSLSVRTIVRNTNWYSPHTLYAHDITINTTSHELFINEGSELFKEKKYGQALYNFQRAAKIAPESELSWYNIGAVYLIRNDYLNAIAYFDKAIEKDRLYVQPYQQKAYALIRLHKLHEARTFLLTSRKIFPNYSPLLYYLVYTEYQLSNKELALQYAKQLYEEQPSAYTQSVHTAILHDQPFALIMQ